MSDLTHYGVKGMKWGVRKNESGPTKVSVEAKGSKLKAKGGTGQPASDDAVRKVTIKQQIKKSGTNSVSNKELQDVIQRMNLEKQYSNLSSSDTILKRIQGTVKTLLGVGKTYNEVLQFANSPGGQQIRSQVEDRLKK